MITVLLSTLLSAACGGAAAAGVSCAALTPAFVIDKSSNRNQVVYALALDGSCALRGNAPVHAFWRMRERGEGETEGLLDWEQPVVGLGPQVIAESRPDGGRVVTSIRGMRERRIAFSSHRVGDRCEAVATTLIGGREAALQRVYAKVWLFGVEYVVLEGSAAGNSVREVLR